MVNNLWDERYSQQDYVYGEKPNAFLEQELSSLEPGTIIFPAEGEGRNAVYAALNKWNVLAFDSSEIAKLKAMELCKRHHVDIQYDIFDALSATYNDASAEVVALIYAHFPPFIRREIHKHIISWLKPGGTIILEAFNPEQLQFTSGGPKELTMLYTQEMLEEDFSALQIIKLETSKIVLNEGPFHQGEAAVIRMIARK